MWGGLVPDALMTLSRLIASLHDDEGNVAVAGLHCGPAADVDYPTERLRAESGIAAGRRVRSAPARRSSGSGPSPSLTITGIDAPKVDGASNTLVASRARQDLACGSPRATPPRARIECLRTHLEAARALGCRAQLHRRGHRRGHA